MTHHFQDDRYGRTWFWETGHRKVVLAAILASDTRCTSEPWVVSFGRGASAISVVRNDVRPEVRTTPWSPARVAIGLHSALLQPPSRVSLVRTKMSAQVQPWIPVFRIPIALSLRPIPQNSSSATDLGPSPSREDRLRPLVHVASHPSEPLRLGGSETCQQVLPFLPTFIRKSRNWQGSMLICFRWRSRIEGIFPFKQVLAKSFKCRGSLVGFVSKRATN